MGGPDGKKDIICIKGGKKWIGAVYFPVGAVRFASIRAKFQHDLQGVPDDSVGIVFVTNQQVTIGQREILRKLAAASGKLSDVLHVERLKVMLDSPRGYGIRAQFLRIPMNLEEQLSWFSDYEGLVASEVAANTRELVGLKQLLARQGNQQAVIKQTMQLIAASAGIATPDLISSVIFRQDPALKPITANLTIELVSLFHRLVCFDLPTEHIGMLRTDAVRVGNYTPPPADQVRPLLQKLCASWAAEFSSLRDKDAKIKAIATFHHQVLFIHPFFEGNGRASRALLAQQALDLFRIADMSLMDRGDAYYRALEAGDGGNLRPLEEIIRPIVQT